MSFHSVQKGFNWPPEHLNDVLSDPNQEVANDVQNSTGLDIVGEALNPAKSNTPLSMQGLARASKLGSY
jgi:hypothetical protein